MVSLKVEALVQHIHHTPTRIVLATTGGGSCAIAQLMAVPGASRTVFEAIVPYAEPSLVQFTRGNLEQLCSAATARAMAMAAWQRAVRYATEAARQHESAANQVAGIGCTAALATDRPRRGAHRVHVAVQTSTATWTASITLAKGRRSRSAEETVVGRLMLNEVAAACGLEEALPLELFEDERVEIHRTDAKPDWIDLLLGRIDATCAGASAPPVPEGHGHPRRMVLPGAFNPLHAGHHRMAKVAQAKLGQPVEFELSIENVDKAPLDYTEIARRLEQFSPTQPVWLTRSPTFLAKSRLFPAATFVVGADTIARIADSRYYSNDQVACAAAIDEIAQRGCRFLVFGRLIKRDFRSLPRIDLPSELGRLCSEIPEVEFRVDISSTELRRQAGC